MDKLKFPKPGKSPAKARKERVPPEIRRDSWIKNSGVCPVCGRPIDFPEVANERQQFEKSDPHHAAIHDTNGNRKNYPHIIDSAVVIEEIHRSCHAQHPGFGHWPEAKADAMELLYEDIHRLITEFELTPEELRGIELDFKRMYKEAGR